MSLSRVQLLSFSPRQEAASRPFPGLLGEKSDSSSLPQENVLTGRAVALFLVGWRPLVTGGGTRGRAVARPPAETGPVSAAGWGEGPGVAPPGWQGPLSSGRAPVLSHWNGPGGRRPAPPSGLRPLPSRRLPGQILSLSLTCERQVHRKLSFPEKHLNPHEKVGEAGAGKHWELAGRERLSAKGARRGFGPEQPLSHLKH